MVDEIENIKDQGDDQENEEKKVDLPAETETEDEKKQDLQVKLEENKDKKSNNANRIAKIVVGAFIVAVAIIIFIPKSPEKHGESRSNTQSSTTRSATTKETEDEEIDKKAFAKNRDKLQKKLESCSNINYSKYTEESGKKLSDAIDAAKKALEDKDKIARQSAAENSVYLGRHLFAIEMAERNLEKIFRPNDYAKMPYREVARDPSAHKNKLMQITGRVVQVMEGESLVNLRVATKGRYDDVVYVSYNASLMGGKRVLEDDTVTIYGECTGVHSYKATSGATITIPGIVAERIELK